MTIEFSWQSAVSLCPASFCTKRPNLPVSPGISWLPTFSFQTSMMCRFSWLILGSLLGLHRTDQLQLLWHWYLGHRLGLLWWWMVCLGNKPRSFYCFSNCTQVFHFGLLFTNEGYSISSKGFLPTVVNTIVIWIKFTHSHPLLVHWLLKCWWSLLPSSIWPHPIYLDSWCK